MKSRILLFLAVIVSSAISAQSFVTLNYDTAELSVPLMSRELRQLVANSDRQFQIIPRFPSFGMTKTEGCTNKVVTKSFGHGELTYDVCDYLALPETQLKTFVQWVKHTEENHSLFVQRVFTQKYFIAIWRVKP